jgi:AcrR family transcriptional regulator
MSAAVIRVRLIGMARWQGGASERLQAAALQRFAAQGFEGTTVAEIAETAGLTERTFFRYFADKREVLFYGQDEFERSFIEPIEAADPAADPMSIIAAALDAAADRFSQDRLARARTRYAVIGSDPGLRERELLKMSALAAAMADALRAHGINDTAATLAAESGVAVLRVAFARWLAQGEQHPYRECQRDAFAQLRTLLAPA